MNTSNAESISTNVYNFTLNNETAVEVQNGDQLVIDSTSNYGPIYCLENNGPQNYRIYNGNYSTLLPLDDNYYPLFSVIISKYLYNGAIALHNFTEQTTTDTTTEISSSSNENPPMTPTTHTTATLTLDSNIKKSTTLTPTVHDNTAYTQNTISEYII